MSEEFVLLDLTENVPKPVLTREQRLGFIKDWLFLIDDTESWIKTCSFDELETAAQSVIILRELLKDYSNRETAISSWVEAVAYAVQNETQNRLQYDCFSYQPSICDCCHAYHGHVIGGDTLSSCGFCSLLSREEIQERNRWWTGYPGPFTGYITARITPIEPYKEAQVWGRIFHARLVYKFFSRTYYG